MKYFEINEKFEIKMKSLSELEKEYEGKTKGVTYTTRKASIIRDLNDLKNRALRIGTEGLICHIHGVRMRPHRKNGQVMVRESFNIYFINISEVESVPILKLHVKNAITYNVRFIQPGVLITTP